MELQSARQIIDTLAQGIHPVTGEAMPEDSPYNAPPVIRALFAVSRALDGTAVAATQVKVTKVRNPLPPNAGKPWTEQDDATLESAYASGQDFRQIAESFGRTRFGIEQRLIKLGKIAPPAGGGRFG